MIGALKMILPLIPMEKVQSMLVDNADLILQHVFDKAVGEVQLRGGEDKACVFVFPHELNGDKTFVSMVVTVDENMDIMRKVSFSNLKDELKKVDLKKIIDNLKNQED